MCRLSHLVFFSVLFPLVFRACCAAFLRARVRVRVRLHRSRLFPPVRARCRPLPPRGPSSLLFSRLLRAALVDMSGACVVSVYWALWVRLPRAQGRLDLRGLREPRVDLARRARSAASCRPARGAPLPRPLVSFLFSCGPRGCRGQAAAASCCHALFRIEIFVAQCCAFPRGLALPLPCVGVPMAMHRVPMAMVFHWLPQKAAIYYYLLLSITIYYYAHSSSLAAPRFGEWSRTQ